MVTQGLPAGPPAAVVLQTHWWGSRKTECHLPFSYEVHAFSGSPMGNELAPREPRVSI